MQFIKYAKCQYLKIVLLANANLLSWLLFVWGYIRVLNEDFGTPQNLIVENGNLILDFNMLMNFHINFNYLQAFARFNPGRINATREEVMLLTLIQKFFWKH